MQNTKTVYRYTYDDLHEPNNNCIVSTIVQLAEICKMPYRSMQNKLVNSNVYYDKNGLFKVERRIHYMAKSKIRK